MGSEFFPRRLEQRWETRNAFVVWRTRSTVSTLKLGPRKQKGADAKNFAFVASKA
jgi:hypothetical protein